MTKFQAFVFARYILHTNIALAGQSVYFVVSSNVGSFVFESFAVIKNGIEFQHSLHVR
jgi:hypothetical protein